MRISGRDLSPLSACRGCCRGRPRLRLREQRDTSIRDDRRLHEGHRLPRRSHLRRGVACLRRSVRRGWRHLRGRQERRRRNHRRRCHGRKRCGRHRHGWNGRLPGVRWRRHDGGGRRRSRRGRGRGGRERQSRQRGTNLSKRAGRQPVLVLSCVRLQADRDLSPDDRWQSCVLCRRQHDTRCRLYPIVRLRAGQRLCGRRVLAVLRRLERLFSVGVRQGVFGADQQRGADPRRQRLLVRLPRGHLRLLPHADHPGHVRVSPVALSVLRRGRARGLFALQGDGMRRQDLSHTSVGGRLCRVVPLLLLHGRQDVHDREGNRPVVHHARHVEGGRELHVGV